MSRGGRRKERNGPERRCIATGESGSPDGLIRFALDPDGVVTPDLAERLPGRGIWVTARRDLVEKAVKKNLFSRSAKRAVKAPQDLADQLEQALARRAVEALGLTRKSGLATNGFEKVRARLKQGPVAALIEARDGSEQGRARLRPMAGDAPILAALTASELGLAFGRDSVIHAALDAGGAAERVVREVRRLDGFRAAPNVARNQGSGGAEGENCASVDAMKDV